MKEAEFRAWLEARRRPGGEPLTEKAIYGRLRRLARLERSLVALGFDSNDLDAVIDGGRYANLTAAVKALFAPDAPRPPVSLVPQAPDPAGQLRNIYAVLRQYGQYREAEGSAGSGWPELEQLRAVFLDRVPEFERFDRTDNEYERVERTYKDAMIAQVQAIAASDNGDEAAGRRIFRALIPNEGPLLRWQTDDDFARKFPALAPAFYTAIGRLARDTGSTIDAIMAAADTFAQLRTQGATTLTMGEIVSVAFSVAGMARPSQAVPFKISKAQALGKLLTGDAIFTGSVLQRDQVERWLDLLWRIEAVMRDEWHWHPRDLIDVQGFAWVALDEKWKVEEEMDELLVLYDAAGVHYRPWLQGDPPKFEIKPRSATSNRTEEMIHTSDETEVCRALLIDGLAVRIRRDGDSWQNLITYPGRKFVGYDLRPDMAAALGIPAKSGWSNKEEWSMSPAVTPDPTNLILYGPPGTGKTYATAAHAVRLCGEDVPADRTELMAAYKRLSDAERIEFVTFHQSMAYEEFVEGLRPSSVDGTDSRSPQASASRRRRASSARSHGGRS